MQYKYAQAAERAFINEEYFTFGLGLGTLLGVLGVWEGVETMRKHISLFKLSLVSYLVLVRST